MLESKKVKLEDRGGNSIALRPIRPCAIEGNFSHWREIEVEPRLVGSKINFHYHRNH